VKHIRGGGKRSGHKKRKHTRRGSKMRGGDIDKHTAYSARHDVLDLTGAGTAQSGMNNVKENAITGTMSGQGISSGMH